VVVDGFTPGHYTADGMDCYDVCITFCSKCYDLVGSIQRHISCIMSTRTEQQSKVLDNSNNFQ
jgi:hypothetical protein